MKHDENKALEFVIDPYVGALPITFAMNSSEVAKLIGPPERSRTNDGEIEEIRRPGKTGLPLHVFYLAAGEVAEIEFGKTGNLKYKKIEMFKEADVIRKLAAEDKPKEFLGTIIFLGLGIAVRGFHESDTQKSVTVFRKGRWDSFLDSDDFVDMEL